MSGRGMGLEVALIVGSGGSGAEVEARRGELLPETAEDPRPLLWPEHQAILLCRKAKRAELRVGDRRVGREKEEAVPYLIEAQAEKDQVKNGLDQDGSLPNDQNDGNEDCQYCSH